MTWDPSKYFSKVQVYWRRATDLERGSEEYLLNVAFACEFLTRGALTNHNPALNAALDVESILYACGIAPKKPARTVDLSEGLERLQRLMPSLTEVEITTVRTLVDARNRELHGDLAEIAQIVAKTIVPNIYSFVVKVAEFAKQDLVTLLGKDDAEQAKQIAEAMKKDRARRVGDLIRSHKDRFFSSPESEQLSNRENAKTDFHSAVLTSGNHVKKEKCPACAELGLIAGPPVGRSAPLLRGKEIIQEVRIVPQVYLCKCCDLKISGLDELIAAGFSHEYYTVDDIDPIEHFNIDPMDHIDVDEIVREYNEDAYGYQDE